jgi:hypothetical protein
MITRVSLDPRGSRSVMAAQDGSLNVFDVDWAVEAHIAADLGGRPLIPAPTVMRPDMGNSFAHRDGCRHLWRR